MQPSPQAVFRRRSHRNSCTVSKSDSPCSVYSRTAAARICGDIKGRPLAGGIHVGEHPRRDQRVTVLGQERKHIPGRDQIPAGLPDVRADCRMRSSFKRYVRPR